VAAARTTRHCFNDPGYRGPLPPVCERSRIRCAWGVSRDSGVVDYAGGPGGLAGWARETGDLSEGLGAITARTPDKAGDGGLVRRPATARSSASRRKS
jgi:hypothetical protein